MIGLYIIGYIVSFISTIVITVLGAVKGILDVCEKGYILDSKTLNEVAKNKTKSKYKKMLDKLEKFSMFIPIVNVLIASLTRIRIRRILFNDKEFISTLVKMTDEEKKQYDRLKLVDKLDYVTKLSEKIREENTTVNGDYLFINNDRDQIVIRYGSKRKG